MSGPEPKDLLIPWTEWGDLYELRCERCGAAGARVTLRDDDEPMPSLCPRCRVALADG